MKKLMVLLIFTVIIAIFHITATAERELSWNYKVNDQELYAETFVVTNVDYEKNIVKIEDSGNVFYFYGTEDWLEGDLVSCIMDTNGTEKMCYRVHRYGGGASHEVLAASSARCWKFKPYC